VATEVEGQREVAPHIVEALDQAAGDLTLEERLVAPAPGRTLAPLA